MTEEFQQVSGWAVCLYHVVCFFVFLFIISAVFQKNSFHSLLPVTASVPSLDDTTGNTKKRFDIGTPSASVSHLSVFVNDNLDSLLGLFPICLFLLVLATKPAHCPARHIVDLQRPLSPFWCQDAQSVVHVLIYKVFLVYFFCLGSYFYLCKYRVDTLSKHLQVQPWRITLPAEWADDAPCPSAKGLGL